MRTHARLITSTAAAVVVAVLPATPAPAASVRLVGCPGATYADVPAAVAAARPGDTVRVCAGTYPAPVTVDKPLTLLGLLPVPAEQWCDDAVPDPAQAAVLTGGLTIAADRVTVRGLVLQGSGTAVTTSDAYSGARVVGNVVRDNADFGIELESSGRSLTEVRGNCVRDNPGGGVVSEDGDLRRAAVTGNTLVDNGEAVTVVGGHVHDRVDITGNTVRGGSFGLAIGSSTRSSIAGNRVDLGGAGTIALSFGGGNRGLRVSGNDLTGAVVGMFFDRSSSSFVDPDVNTGLVVDRNTVHGNLGAGISQRPPAPGEAGQVVRSLFLGNTMTANGATGLFLGPGADGNVVALNRSTDNGRYGIGLLGATGSVVLGNTMRGNAVLDALDQMPDANTWIANACGTASPSELCTGPAPAPGADLASLTCLLRASGQGSALLALAPEAGRRGSCGRA